MFKKIASVALCAVTVSALAQTATQTTTQQTTTTNQATGSQSTVTTTTSTMAPMPSDADWHQRHDTFHIASVDLNSLSAWELSRIVHRNLRDINAGQQFAIIEFLGHLPGDQEFVMLRCLANNYKQAIAVRDEVAMARFGTDSSYAWLAYPPLTWTDTPGQNSWSTLTFSDNGSTTTTTTTTTTQVQVGPLDDAVAMTDDPSRPMRMLMSHSRDRGAIDYDRAVDTLCSGMDGTDRGVINDLFHPIITTSEDAPAARYTNEEALDAIICLIQNNAMMVHYLDRYSWYNHFDPNYYTSGRWQWGY
jgi:guanyl-specific ribonuclease Sa